MIANLFNAVLGIVLVYCAVLSPVTIAGPTPLLVAGVAVILLALWARPTDVIKWFSATDIVLGAVLAVLGGIRLVTELHPLLLFWSAFWVGIIVAVLSFWSALYRDTKPVPV